VQRERLYLYHDLFGYLLEMSLDLKLLLDEFESPRCLDEVGHELAPEVFDEVVDTFIEHDCLLPAGADEWRRLVERIPWKSPWRVALHVGSETHLAVGRSPEHPPRHLTLTGLASRLWKLIDDERSVESIIDALVDENSPPGMAESRVNPKGCAQEAHNNPDRERSNIERQVLTLLSEWTHSEQQLTRIHSVPRSFYKSLAPPPYLASSMPFARLGEVAAEMASVVGASERELLDLEEYHQTGITNALEQFEDVETTLSHLFRVPHVAPGGLTYAQRVVEVFFGMGWLREGAEHTTIVEVGGGVGIFASGFVESLTERLKDFSYTVVDLSPELRRSQTQRLARFPMANVRAGDGQALDLPSGSVELLVCNEVIADFRSARMSKARAPGAERVWSDPDAMLEELEESDESEESEGRELDCQGPPEALEQIARYGLDLSDAPESFLLNTGAIAFLEQAWRVLAPGGRAFVTEFGHLWKYPVESTHLAHAEVSIHFGHLQQVADALGFEVAVCDLPDFLELDGTVEVLSLSRTQFRLLRSLFSKQGAMLRKIAYTRSMLMEDAFAIGFRSLPSTEAARSQPPRVPALAIDLDAVEGLWWTPLEERVMGLKPREFKVLLLRKPLVH